MSTIPFVLPVPCLAGIKLELRPHAFQCLQGGRKPRSSGDRTHQLSALASPRFVRMVCRCLMKLHGHPSTLIQAREAFGKCRSDKVFGLGLTLFPECPVCGFAKLAGDGTSERRCCSDGCCLPCLGRKRFKITQARESD